MPFVSVDLSNMTSFRLKDSGRSIVPVGVNYFDPECGWAPKLWQQFDESRVRRHLLLLHEQGFNTIRVFLTLATFHRESGRVTPEAMDKFRKLLTICHEYGIYVIPTGPDHWEGVPVWRKGDRFVDESVLQADENWWRDFAGRCRDESAILAYDLFNEPAIGWDSPGMKAGWNTWLQKEYKTAGAVAKAWKMSAVDLGSLGTIAVPEPKAVKNDQCLYDYQRYREYLADEWTRRMTSAIRSVDRRHMITIGHIQWTSPIYLPAVKHYAGFNLRSNARWLDFVTIHLYPLDLPRPCDSADGIAVNASYLEALLYQASVGKPLMLGEFGWYGGGAIVANGQVQMPDKPVSHQVEWNQELLKVSRGRVCGWLNWAFADTPTSTDLTRWSGCWTTDLKLKPWGEMYARVAREEAKQPDKPNPFPQYLTSSPVEYRALVTDPESGNDYRRQLRERKASAK